MTMIDQWRFGTAKVIAKDQRRTESEVLAALEKLADLYPQRPMT